MIYGKLFIPVLSVICSVLFTACRDEDRLVDHSLVTLKLILPGNENQNIEHGETRAGTKVDGSEAESKINTLRILIYNRPGTTVEIYKCIHIKDDWTSDDPLWDAHDRALRIPMIPGPKQIYCIANWEDPATADMPAIDASTAGNVNTLLAIERKHDGIVLANPPVMTASMPSVNITATTQDVSVQFRRQVARVELWPNLSQDLVILGAKVKVTGVKFRNLPTKSYLFPKTPVANPSATGQWDQNGFIAFTSDQMLGQTAIELDTKCYIPEYKPAGKATATVMVIQVDFNGRKLYYSVLIDPSAARPVHPAHEIERNHTYRYYLTIIGEGSEVETRSIGSQVGTNLIYKLKIE
jgi:hypothetical protein